MSLKVTSFLRRLKCTAIKQYNFHIYNTFQNQDQSRVTRLGLVLPYYIWNLILNSYIIVHETKPKNTALSVDVFDIHTLLNIHNSLL